jgi:hypothetical protein
MLDKRMDLLMGSLLETDDINFIRHVQGQIHALKEVRNFTLDELEDTQ